MGLVDVIKQAAAKARDAADILAVEKAGNLWAEYGDAVCAKTLALAEQAIVRGKSTIVDDGQYQNDVVIPLWEMLPAPIRLIGRERMQWDRQLLELRSRLFQIDGENLALHPEAAAITHQMVTDILDRAARFDTSGKDSGNIAEPAGDALRKLLLR